LLLYPSVAVTNRIVGIYDIAAYHDVEAFYFRHSSSEITGFTPDYLWPSRKVDYLYRRIAQTAKQHAKEFLAQHACDVADPVHGLLDPGYVRLDRHNENFLSRVRRWFVSTEGA
jgi:hypothetical protein